MSALYPKFAQAQYTTAPTNLLTADIRAALIDTADEAYNAADEFLSDVTGAGIVGTPVALASKTLTSAVLDAADTTILAVSGDSVEAVLLYVHTGTASTSRLIAFIDTATLTPNGGDITIQWDNGANKIAKFA